MPIYEYRCNACGHKLESLQRLSDAPLVTCPACGKDALAKQLSAAGFQLKGSGWYATDFKNSGSKPPAKDAAKPDAKADAPARRAGAKPSRTRRPPPRRMHPPHRRHQVGDEQERNPQHKRQAGARPARPPEARDLAQGIGRGAEALPDRRASRLGSARHHHLGAAASCCRRSTRRCCWCPRARAPKRCSDSISRASA